MKSKTAQARVSGTPQPAGSASATIEASQIAIEEDIICEALVREIGRSARWTARVDAFHALLAVRSHAATMRDDYCHRHGPATAVPNTGLERTPTRSGSGVRSEPSLGKDGAS